MKGYGFQPFRTLKKLRKRSGFVIDSYEKGGAFTGLGLGLGLGLNF